MNPPVEQRGILLTSSTWTVPDLAPAPTLIIPLDPGEIPVPYSMHHYIRGCGEERFAENAPPMRAQRVNLDLNNYDGTKYIPSQPQDQSLTIKVPETTQK